MACPVELGLNLAGHVKVLLFEVLNSGARFKVALVLASVVAEKWSLHYFLNIRNTATGFWGFGVLLYAKSGISYPGQYYLRLIELNLRSRNGEAAVNADWRIQFMKHHQMLTQA